MLMTFLKHEFFSTSRKFGILYLGIALLTISVIVFDDFEPIVGTFTLAFFACFVLLIITIISTFEKSIFTSQAQLDFTLPISTHTYLIAKVLINVFWLLCSIAVFVACLSAILYAQNGFAMLGEFFRFFVYEMQNAGFVLRTEHWIFFYASWILSFVQFLLLISFVCAAVHTRYFRKNKKVMAVVLYFVVSFIFNTIITMISPTGVLVDGMYVLRNGDLVVSLIIQLCAIAVLYASTYYFLNYELEIE